MTMYVLYAFHSKKPVALNRRLYPLKVLKIMDKSLTFSNLTSFAAKIITFSGYLLPNCGKEAIGLVLVRPQAQIGATAERCGMFYP